MYSSKLLSQRRKREIQERFQWPSPKKDPPKMDKAGQVREVSYETGGRTWNIDPGSVRKVSWSNLIYTGKMPRTACGWQKLRRANRLIMSTSARTIYRQCTIRWSIVSDPESIVCWIFIAKF
jgi:hypothetical protein